MKLKTKLSEAPYEVSRIKIFIGEHRFCITDVNERLTITKMSDSDSDDISIIPCSYSQIQLL